MLRMKNGDYVPKGSGLETVSGSEAVLQRVLLRLTARLAEETGLTVDSVTLTQSGGECAALTVQLTAGDTALTAEVALR